MSFYLEMRDEDGNISRVELRPSQALERLDSVPESHTATVVSPSGERWTAEDARNHFQTKFGG